LQRRKVVVYPEGSHFPELEDLECFKSLLENWELWSGLRSTQSSQDAESIIVVEREAKLHERDTDVDWRRVDSKVCGKVPQIHL